MTGAETHTIIRPTPYWRIRPQWGYDPTVADNLSIKYYRVEYIFGTWFEFEGNFDTVEEAKAHCATFDEVREQSRLEVRIE